MLIFASAIKVSSNMDPENNEILPVVDESGRVTGSAPRHEFHFNNEKKMLHPVVHLHFLSPSGELFLQDRPAHKKVQPEKWDTAVGGHVSFGENTEEALERETAEEIGLKPAGSRFLRKYIWETEAERELVYLYVLVSAEQPIPDEKELSGGKFWELQEMEKNIGKNIFTPNLEHEINILKEEGILQI